MCFVHPLLCVCVFRCCPVPQASLKLGEELAVRNVEIQKRKAIVETDLSQAEPALIAAQKSVKNIKKQQLDELR